MMNGYDDNDNDDNDDDNDDNDDNDCNLLDSFYCCNDDDDLFSLIRKKM